MFESYLVYSMSRTTTCFRGI